MSTYIHYPNLSVPTYASFAALPTLALDGAVAVTVDTDTIYVFNLGTLTWIPTGGATIVLSVGTIDSQTKSANGGVIASNALVFQTADATFPGLVSTGVQSFAGAKTFTGAISASNLSGTNTGDVTIGAFGSTPNTNGLSLSGQIINLQPADATRSGGLSTADWNTFNSKQPAGSYVTAISVSSANGFAGSSGGGTTPALTLSTSITGILKGNGTAISAATSGTDYSLGTSGLTTGILKSTTTTGALTIAVAGDFPTLNQNTSGTAAIATTGTTVSVSNSVSYFPLFVASSSNSNQAFNLGTGLSFNPSTNVLTTTTFSGALSGNATTATSATSATTATTATNLAGGSGGTVPYQSAAGTTAMLANGTAGQYLKSAGGTSAPAWQSFTAPTLQKFITGSGTYTTPANVLYLKIRLIGGGGGASGSGTASGGNGSTGGDTTFGSSLLTGSGGVGGHFQDVGGAGGAASLGTGPIGIALSGGTGMAASSAAIFVQQCSSGAASPFGGGGQSTGVASTGGAAPANTGAGGGGAGTSTSSSYTGAGGGAGGYVDAIITSPSATYAYGVGAGGGGGTAGTSGNIGGAGAVGIIIVEEHYQ